MSTNAALPGTMKAIEISQPGAPRFWSSLNARCRFRKRANFW